MTQHLQKVSSVLFYLLGSSFFLAFLFMRTDIGGSTPGFWLRVADLPLALVACLYGGTSLYLSVSHPDKSSKTLAFCIGFPLAALFVFLFFLNFWEVLGLPIEVF